MKIALMTGAVKNAGDFLITQRSEELLKHVYPDCEITRFARWLRLDERLDEINRCDVMVFAGGPAYVPNLYPSIFPLVEDLNEIKPKMFALGMGGWIQYININDILHHKYEFDNGTKRLLNRIVRDSHKLGCRDWLSVSALKRNRIYDSVMTGCPAWYDLNCIGNEISFSKTYQKVCISDPSWTGNFIQYESFIKYLRELFSDGKLYFVFHRGMDPDKHAIEKAVESTVALRDIAEQLAIECVDISYSDEGFHIYDDCDLHVGFRVHAHIYNLSRRNKSILIEEDGRGIGLNQALGLPSISALTYDGERLKPNEYMVNNLNDYMFALETNDFIQYRIAYSNMERYFERMLKHLHLIGNLI